jgi:Tfp pilus assembly protein PilF
MSFETKKTGKPAPDMQTSDMQTLLERAENFHRQGKVREAEQCYLSILSHDVNQPLINSRMATLLHQTQRHAEALPFIRQAINSVPMHPELLKLGVAIATTLAENELAQRWLEKLITLKPEDVAFQEQLAGVLIGNHQEAKGLELSKRIIKQTPDSANAYNLKGLALSRLGDMEKGYKAFQKALKLNPGHLAVIRNLLIYGKGKKEPLLDELIPQLEQRLVAPQLAPLLKMNMAYIISMYYEKTKVYDKAFHYLKLGNDINRAGAQYSHAQTASQFEALKATFNRELKIAFNSKGLSDPAPIFILGMPRSGTTLVEQILASHSQVGAEGEILDLRRSFEQSADLLSDNMPLDQKVAASLQVAERYLTQVRKRQQALFFTDKMPYNFMLVGLIALALPKAKIIHCTRDPLETCYSIYKQNFSGSPAYTNDLNELGCYYKEYDALMKHWQSLFGEQIYEANYERMVANAETEIAGLLEFCGLEPEEKCFAFYKNKRAVRTASVSQVRQPIYKDSLKASSPYLEQLAPLIRVLNEDD